MLTKQLGEMFDCFLWGGLITWLLLIGVNPDQGMAWIQVWLRVLGQEYWSHRRKLRSMIIVWKPYEPNLRTRSYARRNLVRHVLTYTVNGQRYCFYFLRYFSWFRALPWSLDSGPNVVDFFFSWKQWTEIGVGVNFSLKIYLKIVRKS